MAHATKRSLLEEQPPYRDEMPFPASQIKIPFAPLFGSEEGVIDDDDDDDDDDGSHGGGTGGGAPMGDEGDRGGAESVLAQR